MTADPRTPLNNTLPEPPAAELSPPGADRPAAILGPAPHVPEKYTGLQLWLHRLSVLLFVLVSATAGVLLVVLPWSPEWTENRLLLTYPGLRAFVANGFVRGVCTGMGVLDIWIGFWEALHYHEDK